MARAFVPGALVVTGCILAVLVVGQLVLPERAGERYGGRLLRLWAWVVLRLAGARVEVTGQEALASDRQFGVYANHTSWLDILALYSALPALRIRFVMKHTIGAFFAIGRYLKWRGHFFLDRASRRKAQTLYEDVAQSVRQNGTVPVFFPEGTTSPNGKLLTIRTAPFEAAVASGMDVLPVAIRGCSDIMPDESVTPRARGTITVSFGNRISPEGKSRKELAHQFEVALVKLGVEKA
jgi:1-acyl-sn-glycerol-3-phosphate acyltransferase